MELFQKITLFITIVGGVNWGLIGFFDYNLVETLFSSIEMLPRIIYSLVGICGVINIGILFNKIESKN